MCMCFIAYITISLSKSDDLTLWKNLFLGKKLLLKLLVETLKLGLRVPKKKGLRVFVAFELMSAE